MAETPDAPQQPQLYLITPPTFDLEVFPDLLARVLDAQAVACVRLALASKDEDNVARGDPCSRRGLGDRKPCPDGGTAGS